MGGAGRSAPLRRTGSLLGLVGLEAAALAGLHWLGRFQGLRIGWDQPVPWLLSSPVQDVLGALLRTVGLVMAYWLLTSTLLYLLASLTRLPSAVRAVRWATLPAVRRVADHAVAVTLATSMVGGGTFGMAGPALAADRARAGPPARKPVAAAQATDSTAYGFDPASPPSGDAKDDSATSSSESSTSSSESSTSESSASTSSTSTSSTTTTTERPTTSTERPTTTTERETTTTERPTTTTERPTTTTGQPTTTTGRETTTTRAATTSTTRPEATTSTTPATRPPATVFHPAGGAPPSSTTTSTTPTTTTSSSATTSTTGRPPAYRFPTATPSTAPKKEPPPPPSGTGGGGNTGSRQGGGEESAPELWHRVVRGDNLWSIARDRLARARSGGSGEPTNREVADYWARVVDANKDRLRSGDPDLIFPGEEVILPPVD